MESKLRLIKAFDMKSMPWKNGGGVTREVAIAPPSATLDSFDWRVSIAEVGSDGPFSRYDGYDRRLIVWKGAGLLINDELKPAMLPFQFRGEDAIQARRLSDAPVKDFGIIAKRGRLTQLTAHTLKSDGIFKHEVESQAFFLCASGELRIEGFYLNPGDVVHAERGTVTVTALEHSNLIIAEV